MSEIAVVGSMTNGHDACAPVPVIEGASFVTVNGIPVALVGHRCQGHSCEDHGYHIPIITSGSSIASVNGVGIATVGSRVEGGGCRTGHRIVTGASLVSVD